MAMAEHVTVTDFFLGTLTAMAANDRRLTLQRLMGLVHAIDSGGNVPRDLATQALDAILFAKSNSKGK